MINIVVSEPWKLSGLYSCKVTFSYNADFINFIKTSQPAHYFKNSLTWEISIKYLAKLVDTAVLYDQVDLQLLPARNLDNSVLLTDDEISGFKCKPFDHQIDAINYGLQHPKFLLLDSMGLGKTNEIIWLAETLHRRGLIDHCLVICGVAALRQNWKSEIKKFSNESVLVLGEKISKKGNISYTSVAERAKQLKEPISEFFVVTNIETLRSDAVIEAISKSANKFGMMAVDEAHKVATKSSQQGSNLLKLKSEFKVAATGTLITNSPISCYVPLSWTENDHSTLTNFKAQYCNFGGFNNAQIIGYKDLDVLKEELDSCSIRRTLDQVRDDMPPQTITTELVEMDEADRKFYEAIKNGVKEEADKIELNSTNLLALTTRLRQATSCPTVLTSTPVASTKLLRAVDLVDELVENKEKVVVMCMFKESVYQLKELLAKYNPLICTGDQSETDSVRARETFMSDSERYVIIGTHQKLGTGFSLNAASYLICTDTPFTWSQFKQSCDRIWRVNNDRPAFITTLVDQDTIDDRVQEIIYNKKDLAGYLEDGKMTESLANELRKILREL